MTQRLFGLLLLLAAFLATTQQLRARHLIGGEITYEMLGFVNNDTLAGVRTYRFTIRMYRDCINDAESGWFDGDRDNPNINPQRSPIMHVNVYLGDAPWTRLELNLDNYRTRTKDEYVLGNRCLATNDLPCQQVGFYYFDLDLPEASESYTVVYQRCCRNDEIVNLRQPQDQGMTYYAEITPEAQRANNSSPAFTSDPPAVFCILEENVLDLSAVDSDGDSLVYQLCAPLLGGSNQMGFIAPDPDLYRPWSEVGWLRPRYSITDQIGDRSTIRLDPSTGELFIVPNFLGVHVIAYCVEEYRQGVLLSTTKREFQIKVQPCQRIVDAGVRHEDNVSRAVDDGAIFIQACGLGPQLLINESTPIDATTTFDWSIRGNGLNLRGTSRDWLTEAIDRTGIYQGLMILNANSRFSACKDTASFELAVYPEAYAEFDYEERICENEPVNFINNSRTDGDYITNYYWDFADGNDSIADKDPSHLYQTPGIFPVTLTVVDNNNCEAKTTLEVDYRPAPKTLLVQPDRGFGCAPYPKSFINLSTPIDETYTFEWGFGDGGTSDRMNPEHTYEQPGTYDVALSIISPRGCPIDTVFRQLVNVREGPQAGFLTDPEQPTNQQPDMLLTDDSQRSTSQIYYVYDGQGELVMTSPTDGFIVPIDTAASVLQVVAHETGCLDSLRKNFVIEAENTMFLPTAFTPNGDGLNDVFLPVGNFEGITDYQLRIWNKYGQRIYVTSNLARGWDGTYNSTPSPGGGYLWDVRYRDVRGEMQRQKGGVTLLR